MSSSDQVSTASDNQIAGQESESTRRQQPTASNERQESTHTDDQDSSDSPSGTYTAPADSIRRNALMAIASSQEDFAIDAVVAGGKELAEAAIGVMPTVTAGRPGLTALSQGVVGAAPGRPGLQRGTVFQLGLASQFNLLTPQVNLLSGPTGRCNDLVRTGFFDTTANCSRHFSGR